MLLRTLQLGARRYLWRPRFYPWHVTAHRTVLVTQNDFGSDEGTGNQILVLRSLIEAFGGEATSTSLTGRIDQLPTLKGNSLPSPPEVRAVLAQLSSCGAIALENLDGTDVIARITLSGAILAYSKRKYATR